MAFSPTIVGMTNDGSTEGVYAEMNNWKVSRRGLFLGGLALAASGCASGAWQGGYPRAGSFRLDPRWRRQRVRYQTGQTAGTIVVNVSERYLYVVQENGWATRYGVAVGEEGLTFKGNATIGAKAEWPSWTPTARMIKRKPHLAKYAGGVPGGENNPLGARALYLYQGGRDTMFRLHGTNEPWLIGSAVSNGCIRLTNDDVIDLYDHTPLGTKVLVI
jgi:lipoprotein-anchoring transpeptidase ErfK/SrfK